MTAPPLPIGPSTPRALLLGLVAGLMAGLFGVGGGVVLVPGLVLIAAMSQHGAHATSLAAIIITAPAALAPFAVEGAVSWPAAGALAAGALIGAVGGADVMKRIPADGLRQLFGAFILLVAARLLLPVGDAAVADAGVALGAGVLAGLAAVGLLTGLLSALMGVGGGIVMVPIMVVGFGFGQHLAEGTSLAVIIPTAIVGAWRHSRSGYTRWRIGMVVGAGGVVGGLAGGSLAQVLDGAVLQALFAVLLVITGVRLILRSRRDRRAGDARIPRDPPTHNPGTPAQPTAGPTDRRPRREHRMTDAPSPRTRLPTGDTLVGRHVVLAPMVEGDLDALHALLADPDVYRSGYVMHRRPSSLEDGRALGRERFLAGQGQADGRGGGRTAYAIRLAADGELGAAGTLVGTSSLLEAHLADERIHLGSTLYGSRWWGTDVNPEAKLLLLAHCLEDCGFGRVKIQTDLLNQRSQAAIAKLGAVREGVMRRDVRREDGSFRDTVVYSILAEEWPAVRAGLEARLAPHTNPT